ncbi:hypothetical protein D1007_30708 [Hordeum vulgare]|nr:hypothetical protein D1007_30708 [Hordeum vulgare]
MAKRNLVARNGDGGPSSPNRHPTVNEDFTQYLWKNNQPVPWPSVVLPERWNLSDSRVPVSQVPADGLERRREIRRRRRILPLDLKFDPGFASTSDLWDCRFIPGVVPEGRQRMYFASAGPGPCPPPPPEQGQAAPLPLEVADPPTQEQTAPLPLEVVYPPAEEHVAPLPLEYAPPT